MTKNLMGLTIGALDQLDQLTRLQLLLKLVLEQIDDLEGEPAERVSLLIRAYLPEAELRLEELQIALQRIRLMVAGAPVQDREDS